MDLDDAVRESVRLEQSRISDSDSVFGDAEDARTRSPKGDKKNKKRLRSLSAKGEGNKKQRNPQGAPQGSGAGRGRGQRPADPQAQARQERQQQRQARQGFDHGLHSTHPDLPPAALRFLARPPSPLLKRRRKPVPPVTPPAGSSANRGPSLPQGGDHSTDTPHDQQASTSLSQNPAPMNADDDPTAQGLDREAHRRLLEANNPVTEPAGKKNQKERVPPERTIEITRADMTPVGDDYMIPASYLAKARRAEDARRRQARVDRLKLDSRLLRTGDWIVMAKDEPTLEWLKELFDDEEFKLSYRATIVAEQANLKYAVRVHPPDSAQFTSEEVLTHLFQDFYGVGYVRIINESRSYKDKNGEVNKAYHKAIKKRQDFDDKGCPFIKTIWIRMSEEAQARILENPGLLDLGIGCTEIEFEKAKDKKNKDKNKEKEPGENRNAIEATSDEEMVNVIDAGSDTVHDESGPENAAPTGDQE